MLKSPAIRYLGLFLILTVAMFSVLATPWAERLFVAPFTGGLVQACAFLIDIFDKRVIATGATLSFEDGRGAARSWPAAMRSRSAPF